MKNYQTKPRMLLLNFFEEHCDAEYSIDAIAEELSGISDISLSAVYRNVDKMVSDGILKKVAKTGSRKFLYQYVGAKKCSGHLHLQCTKCGDISHMENGADEQKLKTTLQKNGFLVDENKTMLYGICKKCN